MTEENQAPASASASRPGARRRPLPDHPVRVALLDLLAEAGTITSTQAAARLGHSSGLCSFHLRQLARYGLVEEAPRRGGGRERPWRLRWGPVAGAGEAVPEGAYAHWLEERDGEPAEWRRDERVDDIVHLTPAERADLAQAFRELLDGYRFRGRRTGTRPVAVTARVFPLPGDPG
ncbi:winged helix-turn-helix domain-containing protein [Streptomyces sp. NPDC051940]|uniref:ArsR/SmtB family transcription factor n=1 Tax=Streptomyces sp. NPDC051940 TaxID=3155675 RepID=UPI003418D959